MRDEDLLVEEFPPQILLRYRRDRRADGSLDATPEAIRTNEARCKAERFETGKHVGKHWDGPPKVKPLSF